VVLDSSSWLITARDERERAVEIVSVEDRLVASSTQSAGRAWG